ncbi:troponin C, skeletal muscle [Elysia marginata]|uniref:Troponin C, skeletal muscle n=1 Tax=Elysia marginata TaxID=1093978 RepID=A0AAV4G2L1_9GAST|nr:troponin C, skeletal muscle [Elysia marginata]
MNFFRFLPPEEDSSSSSSPSIADVFREFFTELAAILKNEDQETCCKEMFRILDDTRKGFLWSEDVRTMLRAMQAQVHMSEQEMDDVLDDIDKNKDGRVDFSGMEVITLKPYRWIAVSPEMFVISRRISYVMW